MIVLIGESASGKSTIEKELCTKYNLKKVVSYTTRPMRNGEQDGVDYHFISKSRFLNLINEGELVEYTKYRDWYYGAGMHDCMTGDIFVANPHGLRRLKQILDKSVISFYLRVSERERLVRIARRGDDILECFRRIISDQGVFQNIESECDYIIECGDATPEYLAEKIYHKAMRSK